VLTVFYWLQQSTTTYGIYYRRFDAISRLAIDASPRALGGSDETTEFRVATDASGVSWIAAREDQFGVAIDRIRVARYSPGTSSTPPVIDLRASMDAWPSAAPGLSSSDTWPSIVISPTGEVWVFWSVRNGSMYYTRFTAGAWEQRSDFPGSQVGDEGPVGVAEPDGSIVVFFARVTGASAKQVMMTRRSAADGVWSDPVPAGLGSDNGSNFMTAVRDADGTIRLGWTFYGAVAPTVTRHGITYRELVLNL
jgi:hypothetical protein